MNPTPLASYPLTPMQQGMLFHHLSERTSGVDVEQIVCRLDEDLEPSRLREAWRIAVERHPALRKSFRWEELDEPLQDVWAAAEMPFALEDWRSIPAAEHAPRFEAFLAEDRERGFDLTAAPVARLAYFRTGERSYVGAWSFHHLLMDGRSFAHVLADVFDAYRELGAGRAPDRTPSRDLAEHVHWLRARGTTPQDEQFWKGALSGVTAPTPLALPGPGPAPKPEGPVRGELELRFPRDVTTRLADAASAQGVTMNTLVQAAWALVLSRYSGERDVVFGTTRAARKSGLAGSDAVVGVFINTLPFRVAVEPGQRVGDWLRGIRATQIAMRDHEQAPLVDIQAHSAVQKGSPLFESILVFDNATLEGELRARGPEWANRRFELRERTSFALTLYAYAGPELFLRVAYDRRRFSDASARRLESHLRTALEELAGDAQRRVAQISILPDSERRRLVEEWNATGLEHDRAATLVSLFEAQVARTPEAVAVVCGARSFTFAELDERANRLAHRLQRLGVTREALVGVATGRSLELFVAVLAVLKAGGAYLPLDPDYPAERIAFMVEDSGVRVILSEERTAGSLPSCGARVLRLDADWAEIAAAESGAPPVCTIAPTDLAYVIYTSGSTGRPKGVMVEHRNVVNFMRGMDPELRTDPPGVWLAVTSLSFDISVLELLWPLTRGFRVVLHAGEGRKAAGAASPSPASARDVSFSLFYFASDEEADPARRYQLVLEGARFADAHGFEAVWTPERHFHRFGGLYPNPAVIGAAIAATTRNVSIRAGSVVLPLHNPLRVAEEWAVVDNLSNGRVGVSFASGWHPNDFVLAPENYAARKELMVSNIDVVRRLWRGEAVPMRNPKGEDVLTATLPRPIRPELPVWVTAAGNPETFRVAGESGCFVLTHLLGQTVEEVEAKIRVYRRAWRDAGHAGEGHVTIMLHAYVGEDVEVVKGIVREPMKSYLRSAMDLIKGQMAAWSAVRTAVRVDSSSEKGDLELLSEEDRESLLEFSFQRYFETSSLLGTVDSCAAMVERLRSMGVDEIACLIDFGVDVERVLAGLAKLDELRRRCATRAPGEAPSEPVAASIARHGATHLQCTPSMAKMLVADPETRAALRGLAKLMIGGEAFPAPLAAELRACTSAEILNMYGPTETTIWSSTHRLAAGEESVPIGRPIANTWMYVLDGDRGLVAEGCAGELYIGGEGVVRGYLGRPELTAERFVPDGFRGGAARMYRTGDVVRHRPDGALEFLGRADQQIKIRGHRIELGEIENALCALPGVAQAVVVAREDVADDVRLVAYFVPSGAQVPATSELVDALAKQLPDFMLPSRFIALGAFPLTPNAKIDRKALPRPDEVAAVPPAAFTSPEDGLELAIADMWQELLGVPQVGRDDNFFDLGGHSLLAVQMHGRLNRLTERRVPLTDIFRFPTVRSLAAFLAEGEERSAGSGRESERGQARRESLRKRRERSRSTRPEGERAG